MESKLPETNFDCLHASLQDFVWQSGVDFTLAEMGVRLNTVFFQGHGTSPPPMCACAGRDERSIVLLKIVATQSQMANPSVDSLEKPTDVV